jgi:hypothetical protein
MIEPEHLSLKWKHRFTCPEHGKLSTERCVICDAEYLAEQRLLRQRLNVDGSPDKHRSIVVDAGVVAPIDQSGSVTSEARALGGDGTGGIGNLAQAAPTIVRDRAYKFQQK